MAIDEGRGGRTRGGRRGWRESLAARCLNLEAGRERGAAWKGDTRGRRR